MLNTSLTRLEELIGYAFRDRALLIQALTHSSRKNDLLISNERLEFLGDAILGGVISEHLFRTFRDYSEGDLTRIKSAVVSRASLARVAKRLDLGRFLIVAKGVAKAPAGHGEEELPTEAGQKKRLPSSLLSNAFEAIIAAVYLDGGGEQAREFVLRHMQPEIERAEENSHAHNYKSALQQYTQQEMQTSPVYEITAEEGPDHVKSFEVITRIQGRTWGSGRGGTKKAAEQAAAKETLRMLAELEEEATAEAE